MSIGSFQNDGDDDQIDLVVEDDCMEDDLSEEIELDSSGDSYSYEAENDDGDSSCDSDDTLIEEENLTIIEPSLANKVKT